MESKLLVNSGVDNDLFADAYALAIKRNDGKLPLARQLINVRAILTRHQETLFHRRTW